MDGTIYSRYVPYLESHVEVTMREGALVAVSFPGEPEPEAEEDHPLLDRLEDYLSGTSRDDFLDVEITPLSASDEEEVYAALRHVEYGENVTVEALARNLDAFDAETPDDHDRIREILDRNPTPLIVPDHRVRDGPSGAPPEIEQRLRSLERS